MDRAEMDLVYQISDHIVSTQFHDLPRGAISSTKKFILDTLGVTIAGCRAQGILPTYELIKQWGGRCESTVIVFGDQIPSIHAAFLNSSMCHAFEFDDTHDEGVLHSFASVLPTALSIAESIENVNGEDFITAVTLGVDLTCRLALASVTPPRWIRSATCGIFGAIAAAGKLLSFERETMVNALGIGYSLVSGNEQCAVDGGLTKRLQPGFAAKAAVLSSLLAQKGITGAKEVFEGPYGYFRLYENGHYDPKRVTEGMGESFEVERLSIKPYPCCRASHSAIDGVLKIMRENSIQPKEVQEVQIGNSELVFNLVGRSYGLHGNFHVDAQFSLPYVVAVAILKGHVLLEDFDEGVLMDSEVLDVAKKVKVMVMDRFRGGGLKAPCQIEIRTTHQGSFSCQIDVMKGHPLNPLTREELIGKFKGCVKYAQKPKIEENTEKIIQMVEQLEDVKNINHLIELVVESDAV